MPISACHVSRSTAVGRSLFAGQTQRRVAKQHRKQCGAQLQPPRGGEPSVGRGVLLRRCATGASWIGYPRTLLTSRCVHAWQDRSRDLSRASQRSWPLCSPNIRAAHAGMRLVGAPDHSEERGRRDCVMALKGVQLKKYTHAGASARVYCGPRQRS